MMEFSTFNLSGRSIKSFVQVGIVALIHVMLTVLPLYTAWYLGCTLPKSSIQSIQLYSSAIKIDTCKIKTILEYFIIVY